MLIAKGKAKPLFAPSKAAVFLGVDCFVSETIRSMASRISFRSSGDTFLLKLRSWF